MIHEGRRFTRKRSIRLLFPISHSRSLQHFWRSDHFLTTRNLPRIWNVVALRSRPSGRYLRDLNLRVASAGRKPIKITKHKNTELSAEDRKALAKRNALKRSIVKSCGPPLKPLMGCLIPSVTWSKESS